jgi:hypothetical protein
MLRRAITFQRALTGPRWQDEPGGRRMQKLTDVVVWKARAVPGNRIIPPHLKLAILSRGRIAVPPGSAEYFLDVAREAQASWPDRMQRTLAEIAPQYQVTFELFLNQRLTMTPDEIREAITEYLTLRRAKLTQRSWRLVYDLMIAHEKPTLQKGLDVDISELFRRPKVTLRPEDNPWKYILLCYVALPAAVEKAIGPKAQVMPKLTDPLAPLDARLKPNTEMTFRDGPTEYARSRWVQTGTAARIKVLEKSKIDGATWYHIELQEPVRVVPYAGAPLTQAKWLGMDERQDYWIDARGIDILVASWALFRNDLEAFEYELFDLSLSDRITAIRQRMHDEATPFDQVIGAKPGKLYLDKVPYEPKRWQLGPDYQAFVAPDGQWIDVQHLMVGLDVLSRPEKNVIFKMYGTSNPIGTNWAASTWSGDTGSAAADATIHNDASSWERWNPEATLEQQLEYYFATRASDHDLLGNLDAWGIQSLREADSKANKLGPLLAQYYEDTKMGLIQPLTAPRKDALEKFLGHYGFTYALPTALADFPVLPRQDAMRGMVKEIQLFGRIWMIRRNNALAARTKGEVQAKHTDKMALMFAWWLESWAIAHEAEVK